MKLSEYFEILRSPFKRRLSWDNSFRFLLQLRPHSKCSEEISQHVLRPLYPLQVQTPPFRTKLLASKAFNEVKRELLWLLLCLGPGHYDARVPKDGGYQSDLRSSFQGSGRFGPDARDGKTLLWHHLPQSIDLTSLIHYNATAFISFLLCCLEYVFRGVFWFTLFTVWLVCVF